MGNKQAQFGSYGGLTVTRELVKIKVVRYWSQDQLMDALHSGQYEKASNSKVALWLILIYLANSCTERCSVLDYKT